MYMSGKYKTATNTFFLEERQNLFYLRSFVDYLLSGTSNFPECKLQPIPAKQ